MVRHHFGGIVVDLSGMRADERALYQEAAHRELEAVRAATGLPHWPILDEAQVPLARDTGTLFEPAVTGYCLVTHRPQDLRPEALLAIDVLIVLAGGRNPGQATDLVAAAGAMPHAAAARLMSQAGPGQAVLVSREHPGTGLVFSISRRETCHIRHWHKYSGGSLSRNAGSTSAGTGTPSPGRPPRAVHRNLSASCRRETTRSSSTTADIPTSPAGSPRCSATRRWRPPSPASSSPSGPGPQPRRRAGPGWSMPSANVAPANAALPKDFRPVLAGHRMLCALREMCAITAGIGAGARARVAAGSRWPGAGQPEWSLPHDLLGNTAASRRP